MNKNNINSLKYYTVIGIIFALLTGTIWHFGYEWSGENFFVGLFFPVNESTWEHMKLCFFPTLLYSLSMNKKLKKEYPCITSSLLLGIITGTFAIPVLFYTYSGILGFSVFIFDIITFIISILLVFLIAYKFSKSTKLASYQLLLEISVLMLLLCFLAATCFPPGIGLFDDPVK